MTYIVIFSGSTILLLFLFVALIIKTFNRNKKYNFENETLSGITDFSENTLLWKVRIICWSVCLLIFPFAYGLNKIYNFENYSILFGLTIIISVSLFITAYTLYDSLGFIHCEFSMLFFYLSWVMLLEIAMQINDVSKIGDYMIITQLSAVIFLLLSIIFYRFKENAIQEISFMFGNALSVILLLASVMQ